MEYLLNICVGVLGVQDSLLPLLRYGDRDSTDAKAFHNRGEAERGSLACSASQIGPIIRKLWTLLQTLSDFSKPGIKLNGYLHRQTQDPMPW